MVDVTVLTPSYNYGRFIEDALLSVRNQRGLSVQHVIQDGGSTDATLQILAGHNADIDWTSEPDGGQSDALNRGLSRATGRWIAWLNADEFYLPAGLAYLVEQGERSGADVVYGECVIVDESGRVARLLPQYRFSSRVLRSYGPCISSCSAIFRRSVLGQDPWNVAIRRVMDWDLYLRLLQKGADFLFVPFPVGAFRMHPDQVTAIPWQAWQQEDEFVAARHGRPTNLTARWRSYRELAGCTEVTSLSRDRTYERGGLACSAGEIFAGSVPRWDLRTLSTSSGIPTGDRSPMPVDRSKAIETRSPQMADPAWTTDVVEEVLEIIGDHVCLLSADWPKALEDTGDIDCAVDGIDHQWPLRLPAEIRLLQYRNYDINSWVWFIERGGKWLMFDCIEDPDGLGRYKFPTVLAQCDDGPLPDPAVVAAYLTAKRLRKNSSQPDEWARIGALGDQNPGRYLGILSSLLGGRYATEVSQELHAAHVPDDELRRRALYMLRRRRLQHPGLAVRAAWKGSVRWLTRVLHPTGLVVALAGPDASGKSTLASELPADCGGLFLRHRHAHWRPGLLPSLGPLAGSAPNDLTRPHGRAPHSPIVSVIALTYYWIDFLLGNLALFAPMAARTGLVVVERGWWDMYVDPARYRIDAPSWIIKALGRLLVQPNLVIVLEARPDVLMARKPEIEREELGRQVREWRNTLPHRVKRAYIDASDPVQEVRIAAREAIVSVLSERAAGRLGAGWIGLPTRSSPRWILPRGPRKAALSALSMYQPVTLRARLGWEIGRGLAASGLLRLIPRGEAPPEAVRAAVAPYVPRRSTLSVLRANHPGRFLVSIVGPDGRLHGVAKIATDPAGIPALEKEAEHIRRLGSLLERPLRAPKILERAPGVLVLEPIRWVPRNRPWVLPKSAAQGLGRAFARWRETEGEGAAHGDCAPWNLLRARDGWVLVDWEEARLGAPPFYDLAHYVVQAHVLLGRPTFEELTGGAHAPWMSAAIRAYAAGSGEIASSWRLYLTEYLHASAERLDPSDAEQAKALVARQRLLRVTEG